MVWRISEFPAVLSSNPDGDTRIEDAKHWLLSTLSLREAQQYLMMWNNWESITEEQAAVMFNMLEDRAKREMVP